MVGRAVRYAPIGNYRVVSIRSVRIQMELDGVNGYRAVAVTSGLPCGNYADARSGNSQACARNDNTSAIMAVVDTRDPDVRVALVQRGPSMPMRLLISSCRTCSGRMCRTNVPNAFILAPPNDEELERGKQ